MDTLLRTPYERLAKVQANLAEAVSLGHRNLADVNLLAVSKGQPLEALSALYVLGVRDFGENYVQECIAKAAEAPWSQNVHWHFIGHLQTNKVKVLLPCLSALHSLDRESLLDALEKHAAKAQRRIQVFVQLEVDPTDENKHGANDAEAEALCVRLARHHGEGKSPYDWVGFMGMGPADAPSETLRALYAAFVQKAQRLWHAHHAQEHTRAQTRAQTQAHSVGPQLSLGMSGDLTEAIAAGSTLVRIGTALFGPRARA